ncbi:capsular biosynthesis protein [Oceanicola sp. 22II-s10i]|uniref:capsular polysaccharide biosynthesis protein n=1 Tax=Oceanicola sp. 22II-s10i TaxID=1317116 RepID=UPI000B51FF0D|nr:capsular polysaccharide biosynthesis protein [Oceanicola sp. 22II-s10i]OWU83241.1 capsular biosynthesis protein [Oceanicola sp. 22II-s10i]
MTGRDGARDAAGAEGSRRLYYFNAGFLRQRRLRRILSLAGYDLTIGRPGEDDLIGVWGRSPYAARGEAMAARTGAALIRIEDAFLRSLHPGRAGEPPTGLIIDRTGMHFDGDGPSDLETLLATHPFDDTALLNRARGGIARLREAHLSKYNAFSPEAPVPEPGYVLVIDQTRGDASVRFGGADMNTFREMLYYAQEEHPAARVLIKTHPETRAGFRPGHFGPEDATGNVQLLTDPVSPWALMEGAIAVYVVSSQLGFEAILAGHRPRVFGRPFYAGWGLTDDRHPLAYPRRGRTLTRPQLFAGAMLLYPTWYDPARDRLGTFEDAMEQLAARARVWREDRDGWTASEMRLWKRPFLNAFFGTERRVKFSEIAAPPRRRMIWASKAAPEDDGVRVEDGFLRSRGLGAELVPPLSLVLDDLGIYYDPTRESRLERLIAARAELRPDQTHRAEALIRRLVALGLSKYNLAGPTPDLSDLPPGRRILVPGQVEDDASIRLGAGQVSTNLALLRAARGANPDAVILYKPHPDVLAGLRTGAVDPADLVGLADAIPTGTDPAALLEQVDEVWTMTSLMGFEGLLRGKPVTVTGAPFYAGWGLTRDMGRIPDRRRAQVTLEGLVHAALIDYPRYRDPVTGAACPVEVAVDRLATGTVAKPGPGMRLLSKAQGALAGYAHLWR